MSGDIGPGVLVLGMHRSGTSALTRAIGLLGLETGRVETVMAPAPSNESGHWEITALTECNDRLLAELGGRWSGPPADLATVADRTTEALGHEARRLVADLLPAAPWAWKDPRLCLTLPFWRSVLSDAPPPALVVSLRNPLEVAESLARRNGFSLAYGLGLWERYLRTVWRHLAGVPVLVVDYAALLAAPGATIEAIADFIEDAAGLEPSGAQRDAAASSLDQAQRHHVVGSAELAAHPAVTAAQRSLYEQSRHLVGPHRSFPTVVLGKESPGMQVAFDEHVRMAAFEDESYRLRAGLDEARAGLDRQTLFFHQELERRSAEASVLATDVMAARDQIEVLQASLDQIRGRLPIRVYSVLRRRLPGGRS